MYHHKPSVSTIASETRHIATEHLQWKEERTKGSGNAWGDCDLVSEKNPGERNLSHLAGQAVRNEVYISTRKAKSKANFNHTVSWNVSTAVLEHIQ